MKFANEPGLPPITMAAILLNASTALPFDNGALGIRRMISNFYVILNVPKSYDVFAVKQTHDSKIVRSGADTWHLRRHSKQMTNENMFALHPVPVAKDRSWCQILHNEQDKKRISVANGFAALWATLQGCAMTKAIHRQTIIVTMRHCAAIKCMSENGCIKWWQMGHLPTRTLLKGFGPTIQGGR